MRRALHCLDEALAIFRSTGNRASQAAVQANLGDVYEHQGAYDQASVHYGQSLAAFQTWARDDATGALPEAREYWQRALAMFEELGVPEADEVRALLK